MLSAKRSSRSARSSSDEVVPVGEADAVVLERGHELLGEHRRLPLAQVAHLCPDLAQQFDEVAAVGARGAQSSRELLHQARHANLEELVEVFAEDREELRPLEQRHRGVLGEREHPRVELEERELAVEVADVAV